MIKLSDIFIPLPNKTTYTVTELSGLNLRPDFIKKMAANFDLSFVEDVGQEGNLCFAQNKEVCPAYRTTFRQADILKIVLPQLLDSTINLEQDKVKFPENVHSFFR